MYRIIVLFVALISCSTAFAGSGKAVVPHVGKKSQIWISNITSNDLKVTVTVYNDLGNVITSHTYYGFQASNTEIVAKGTGYVVLSDSEPVGGFAVIEWENIGTDDDAFGLVAHANRSNSGTGFAWRYGVDVNSGMPF